MLLTEAIRLIDHPNLTTNFPVQWSDLGCGDGLFSKALISKLHTGSTVYAVDKNLHALQLLELAQIPAVKTVHGDFVTDTLPLPFLDGLLMANAFHFVKDQETLLQKFKKMIKEDGCLLFIEYDMKHASPWVPYPAGFNRLSELLLANSYRSIEKIWQMPSRYNRADIYSVIVCK